MALFQQAHYGKIDLSAVEKAVMKRLPLGQIINPSIDLVRQATLQSRSLFHPPSAEMNRQRIASPQRPPPTPEDGGHEEACKRFVARMRGERPTSPKTKTQISSILA